MPHGYKIRGIEPADLRDYAPSVRKLYWSWVVELGLKAKRRDLAAGLDKNGNALRPIGAYTRAHRKSEMTPSGKGDPSAPPLSPGHELSRTQALLAGRALTTHAEFFWLYNSWTGESWDVALTGQAAQGRDVFGLSPKATAWVQIEALRRWNAWKAAANARIPSPQAIAAPRATRPAAAAPRASGTMSRDEWRVFWNQQSLRPVASVASPRVAQPGVSISGTGFLAGIFKAIGIR